MIEVMKTLPNIKAYFSTRQNGCSQKPFESLNLAFHVGDKDADVLKNHQYIKNYFPNSKNISYMKQIHSKIVCDLGTLQNIPECDALITKEKNKILMTMVADCIPILIYDEVNSVIAAVHAGRVGTFKNIIAETLTLMQKNHSSKIEDINVTIGPHIHACCYEVGSEIVDEAHTLGYQEFISKRNERFYLDLLSVILSQLKYLGLKKEKIEILDECTCCNTDRFFSYRKEGQTGRFCGLIMLE